MANILLLETATEVCSAAMAANGKLIASRETAEGFRHSEKLTVFIREILEDQALGNQLPDAVCVSRGPGSYTGLRIGVSAAKGICYALDIPLIAISTLDSLAFMASHPDGYPSYPLNENTLFLPMLDARRMEVYTARYDHQGLPLSGISAEIIKTDSFSDLLENHPVVFLGNGADKCSSLIRHPNAHFIKGVQASARFMSVLAEEQFKQNRFEDVAYFEPFYLKDFVATIPRNKLFQDP